MRTSLSLRPLPQSWLYRQISTLFKGIPRNFPLFLQTQGQALVFPRVTHRNLCTGTVPAIYEIVSIIAHIGCRRFGRRLLYGKSLFDCAVLRNPISPFKHVDKTLECPETARIGEAAFPCLDRLYAFGLGLGNALLDIAVGFVAERLPQAYGLLSRIVGFVCKRKRFTRKSPLSH